MSPQSGGSEHGRVGLFKLKPIPRSHEDQRETKHRGFIGPGDAFSHPLCFRAGRGWPGADGDTVRTNGSGAQRSYVLTHQVAEARKCFMALKQSQKELEARHKSLDEARRRAAELIQRGHGDEAEVNELKKVLSETNLPPYLSLREVAAKYGIAADSKNPKQWWWHEFLKKEMPEIHPDEALLAEWIARHQEIASKHGIHFTECRGIDDFVGMVMQAAKRDAEVAEELEKKDREAELKKRKHDSYREVIEWQMRPLVLQKSEAMLFDNLRNALANPATSFNKAGGDDGFRRNFDAPFQIFAIRHDWAAALNGLVISSEELKLPYPSCMFELVISEKHVCWGAHQTEHDGINFFGGAVKSSMGWVLIPPTLEAQMPHLFNFLRSQTAAILVTLDAEITETEPVRIPEKLNRAREKRGKYRLSDYHVVKLAAHRTRAAPAPWPASDEKRTRLRLHFRRGHWAHYQNYKTWRRWTLVGDPDLGFVDKHYSL